MKVFSLKREKVKIEEAFENRAEFFINNGTLKITNVEKNDSGQYNVDVFDSEASFLKNIYINLDVKGKCLKCNLILQFINALLPPLMS